jgi:DNA repair protein RAD5
VVEELEFSPLERKIYDQIYHDAKTQFTKLDAKGLVGKNFSNILAMLMRCERPL